MKLLLDQNLSHRIVPSLEATYPNSTQVGILGMGEATDKAIWDYAQQQDYVIITLLLPSMPTSMNTACYSLAHHSSSG